MGPLPRDMNDGTSDDAYPFSPTERGPFRPDDPCDQWREYEALENIDKPDERETASYVFQENVPGGVNKRRDNDQSQCCWSHFGYRFITDSKHGVLRLHGN